MKNKNFTLLCVLALFAVLSAVFFVIYVASYEDGEFTQIGNSEFYATPQGKIYALIPSGGKFELKGVQADKFRVLAHENYRGRNVGADENAVYCGNLAMSGLDPARVRTVGNGYVTDGEVGYFCGDAGERNTELGALSEAFGTVAYAVFGSDRPQSYVYKFKRVSSPNLAPILRFGFAAESAGPNDVKFGANSGESDKKARKAYFEGEELSGADAGALRYVGDARGRDSDFYVMDGRNVYFKSSRLALKFTAWLREAAYFGGVHYLFEPSSGAVYADGREFAGEFAPYSLPFGVSGAHAYHLLFRGKGGIYFWQRGENSEKGELKRAGEDPFADEILPLVGSVFISKDQTYFVQSREIWRSTKHGRRLSSRRTGLFRMETGEQWRKIGLVCDGVFGAVYANGDKIYYFDALGTSQFVDSSVYEIADVLAVEILTRPFSTHGKNPSSTDIRKMIKEGRLVPVQGELVFEAVSSYGDEDMYIFWGFVTFMLLVAVTAGVIESSKRAKMAKIEENQAVRKTRGRAKFGR